MVTIAPTAPLPGTRLPMTGNGNRENPLRTPVPPGLVTETSPEDPLATTADI